MNNLDVNNISINMYNDNHVSLILQNTDLSRFKYQTKYTKFWFMEQIWTYTIKLHPFWSLMSLKSGRDQVLGAHPSTYWLVLFWQLIWWRYCRGNWATWAWCPSVPHLACSRTSWLLVSVWFYTLKHFTNHFSLWKSNDVFFFNIIILEKKNFAYSFNSFTTTESILEKYEWVLMHPV